MKTIYGRPGFESTESQRIPKSEQKPSADVGLGLDTVVTTAQRVTTRIEGTSTGGAAPLAAPRVTSEGSIALPTMRAEERLLLGLVDGRLSIRRLARLAGLPEESTLRRVQALCERGVLVPVEKAEITIVGRAGTPTVRLGAYEVAMRIARGGMGSVYLCRRAGSASFRRLYALKVVRQNSPDQDLAEEAFKREVRVGALLSHPNLQAVIDVGTYQEQPYLVLDYLEGCSLEELTASGERLPPGIVISIVLDVLRGLQFAHDLADERGRPLGLVHGDVSPPNVMIGVDGVARLTDFGAARFTAQGESVRDVGGAVGKPAYMAPEQLRNEPLGSATDIFAAGIVLWTALAGRELFAGESYEQIVANVLRGPAAPPSEHGAPACLDEICMRALAPSPEDRFRNADEMARELMRAAVANDLITSPRAVGERVRAEVGEMLLDRHRKVEAAFANAESSTVLSSDGAQPARGAPVSTASDKNPKLAATVLIPGRETVKAKVVVRRPTPPSERATSDRSASEGLPANGKQNLLYGAVLVVGVAVAAVGIMLGFRLSPQPAAHSGGSLRGPAAERTNGHAPP